MERPTPFQSDQLTRDGRESSLSDKTNVLILNQENFTLFYDKCFVIASCIKPDMKKFHILESSLVKLHFIRQVRGKDKPLVKSEEYVEIRFSYNIHDKTYKFTFWFKKGFNPLKVENFARNWLINQMREQIENWIIYLDLELSIDFKESENSQALLLLWEIDRTINQIYDLKNKFIKQCYVKGHWTKLYWKLPEGKVRLEVQGNKDHNEPFEVMKYILENFRNLFYTENRNEMYFNELEKQMGSIEKIPEELNELKEGQVNTEYELSQLRFLQRDSQNNTHNQNEILMKISQCLEKVSQSQDLTANLLINQIDHLSNQNIETQVMIRTNKFWFKIKKFFISFWKLIKRLFKRKEKGKGTKI